MFKVILIIILVVGFSYLFFPYLSNLFTYFGMGKSQISTIVNYIIEFLKTCFNILSTNQYIMIFFSCLLFISLIFFLINYFGGREWLN